MAISFFSPRICCKMQTFALPKDWLMGFDEPQSWRFFRIEFLDCDHWAMFFPSCNNNNISTYQHISKRKYIQLNLEHNTCTNGLDRWAQEIAGLWISLFLGIVHSQDATVALELFHFFGAMCICQGLYRTLKNLEIFSQQYCWYLLQEWKQLLLERASIDFGWFAVGVSCVAISDGIWYHFLESQLHQDSKRSDFIKDPQ